MLLFAKIRLVYVVLMASATTTKRYILNSTAGAVTRMSQMEHGHKVFVSVTFHAHSNGNDYHLSCNTAIVFKYISDRHFIDELLGTISVTS